MQKEHEGHDNMKMLEDIGALIQNADVTILCQLTWNW